MVGLQGTSRKQNEDRYTLDVNEGDSDKILYAGVFDGHGGLATADWLEKNLINYIEKFWQAKSSSAESDIADAFIKADERLLQPKSGFFGGMGERGVGGSKCGSTAAVALAFREGDATKLLAANVGDARVVLSRKGKAVQLTTDHVPDSEEERLRIEATNPNPRLPLVRYVGGTWRVGGILALSRAFGDAYLKGSLQFEGVRAGGDGYSSGFGLVSEPDTTLIDLTADDEWLILASDGLFANVERGGGGGLENQEVVDMCIKSGASPEQLAKKLAFAAQEAGSTDDVTVVVVQLGK
ncbi:hypothetical protein WJX75_008050 [Coccomyxa subellipsoidea]|uniref:protein-serine/threonine phosphatase n=1 Tax=Coccomyxa subellipsoidea TaxID=248742 RepID=A0ABR2YFF5_9CHLO